MIHRQSSKKGNRDEGFSLVEVTIAIGIVAYAMLGLMGVFAVGIKANHESKNMGAFAQITALASTNYRSHVAEGGSLPYKEYYTFDGDPVDATDPLKHYEVTVDSVPSDGTVIADTSSNLHLITLTISTPTDSKPKILRTAAYIQ